MKTVVHVDEHGEILLDDLAKLVKFNPSDVYFYSVEKGENETLLLSLYDYYKKPIKVEKK